MADDPLLAPIEGAEHRELGGVEIDVVPLADGRLKRAVYPPGHRWSETTRGSSATSRPSSSSSTSRGRGRG